MYVFLCAQSLSPSAGGRFFWVDLDLFKFSIITEITKIEANLQDKSIKSN
jgi:hypothetical protein